MRSFSETYTYNDLVLAQQHFDYYIIVIFSRIVLTEYYRLCDINKLYAYVMFDIGKAALHHSPLGLVFWGCAVLMSNAALFSLLISLLLFDNHDNYD